MIAELALALMSVWMGVQDTARIEQWIKDLGSDEYLVREKSEEELVKAGRAALPALREAAKDKDAERAARARRILDRLDKPKSSSRVELTVREGDRTRRYEAESLDQLRELHPELKRSLEVFLKPWMPFPSELLDRWFDEKHPRGSFGLRVGPVSEALVEQIGVLGGLVVEDVLPGSAAERCGLRKHDLVLKLDGKAISSAAEFRRKVRELLSEGFELEILRKGKPEVLRHQP